MTGLQIVLCAAMAPFLASAVLVTVLGFRAAFRDLYPDRPGRDDEPAVTAVRAPLAIEGAKPWLP